MIIPVAYGTNNNNSSFTSKTTKVVDVLKLIAPINQKIQNGSLHIPDPKDYGIIPGKFIAIVQKNNTLPSGGVTASDATATANAIEKKNNIIKEIKNTTNIAIRNNYNNTFGGRAFSIDIPINDTFAGSHGSSAGVIAASFVKIQSIANSFNGSVLMIPVERVQAQSNDMTIDMNRIGVPQINNTGTSNINETVVVIDTGVDLTHNDLNVDTNLSRSFVAGTSSANDDSMNGHGTNVAGIIGAKSNGDGVTGVAPGARIIALKVLDKNGSGNTADILAAIDYLLGIAKKRKCGCCEFKLGLFSKW